MKLLIIDNNPDAVEVVKLTVGMIWPKATTLSAFSGKAGIDAVDSEEPNLVVLDVDLPDMDGLSVLREIRRFSDVPIIMLTERDNEADILRGLNFGADDCIVKPLDPIVFMARAKAVLRRADPTQSLAVDKTFEYRGLKVYFGASRVTLKGRVLNLTPTEYRLLCKLVKNAGKIVSSRTLLGLDRGREHLEVTSLKVNIQRIRSKLGEDPAAPKYIFTKRNVGYGFAMTGQWASS